MALSRKLGVVGRRLFLVALVVAVYEIHEAEDKPREVTRQGVLMGAGVVGGSVATAGAVATGVCAVTAPICLTLAALAGGVLLAYGADLTFGTIYPKISPRTSPPENHALSNQKSTVAISGKSENFQALP